MTQKLDGCTQQRNHLQHSGGKKTILIFDLETNGLLEDVYTIHCLCIYNTETKLVYTFDPQHNPVEDGLEMLASADVVCGHNIIGYDLPVIRKLYPKFKLKKGCVVRDTLVMTRLIESNIKDIDFGLCKKGFLPGYLIGTHKLEAWGYRLQEKKGDYGKSPDAWEKWTPAMSRYCKQDVRVTVKLFDRLMEKEPSEEAVQLEHDVQEIISRQICFGFFFNVDKAQKLHVTLMKHLEECESKLKQSFPPYYFPKSGWISSKDDQGVTVKQAKYFTPKRDNSRLGYIAGASLTKIELTDFNPGSNQHIAYVLKKKYGWVPVEYTPNSGEPKIDETILKELPYPEAPDLIRYLMLKKRISQLATGDKAWLKYVEADNRIHGYVNSCGAVTGRMTHSYPNIAQVPAGYSPFGHECRSLFTVPEGKVLVGCDASGIEARCLAHYLAYYDGGAYAQAVLNGVKEEGTDVHSVNAKALGCSRDVAKTWFYAWMYGAGTEKLAKILSCTPTEAKKKGNAFLKALPAFGKLVAAVQNRVKNQGYIIGLDGRKLHIRSQHSALNTLLQSAGAVTMKKALVLADQELTRQRLDYAFVANVHDEVQVETIKEHAELVGETIRQAIIHAGEHFNFRCPQDGEYIIGKNWAETH